MSEKQSGIEAKAEYFINIFIDRVHQAGDINKTTEEREYENAISAAIRIVQEIKKYVPMYIGNLNPAWKELEDVRIILETKLEKLCQ